MYCTVLVSSGISLAIDSLTRTYILLLMMKHTQLNRGGTRSPVLSKRYSHFIPVVGVGKRGKYLLVHGDLPRRQHSFGTTLRFTGPVPADSRQ